MMVFSVAVMGRGIVKELKSVRGGEKEGWRAMR